MYDMEKCSKCGVEPRTKWRSTCKACSNEYQKAWYKSNPEAKSRAMEKSRRQKKEIRELILAAKSVPCMDCGESYPYYVMDLDHVRGKKRFGLSGGSSITSGVNVIKEEIAKCDPVCSNCHRMRTHNR